ncbi:MAG: hypothetical protein KY397_05490 [Gemmatimonadetes bacterium]|nr:hypothetical protein [Gemmatimonadota bacterium]
MDPAHLDSRAVTEQVADALGQVRALAKRAPGGADGIEEAERWARTVR